MSRNIRFTLSPKSEGESKKSTSIPIEAVDESDAKHVRAEKKWEKPVVVWVGKSRFVSLLVTS